jgi:hypothetical protein
MGLWKQYEEISKEKNIRVSVSKTKAHRTQKQAQEQGDLANYEGNLAADKAAIRGAQVYHGPQDMIEEEQRLQKSEQGHGQVDCTKSGLAVDGGHISGAGGRT